MINSFQGGFRFLSNFWPARVTLDNEEYISVENAYQAAKTLNKEKRKEFRFIPPGKAKRLGRTILIRSDWDKIKLDVMELLVRQKFQSGILKDLLIKTGNEELIEGNNWNDTFWGICNNKGMNHLGRILMKIRSELNQR